MSKSFSSVVRRYSIFFFLACSIRKWSLATGLGWKEALGSPNVQRM
jgi:hypothetical protein